MPNPPRRLGRGLSSIISIPEPEASAGSAVSPGAKPAVAPLAQPEERGPAALLKVNQLRPNPQQPRREFPPEHLKSLADSIAKDGVIQPLVVRQAGDGLYEIVVGERRWRAAQMAGLKEVPAVIREATDEQMLEVALVENIFREDLNAIDRAMAYRRYCEAFGLSADQVAQRLNEDRTTVANYLRLLDLPNEVKQWVVEGRLSMGHARCLLGLSSPTMRVQVGREAIEKDWSVRVLEKVVKQRQAARSAPAGAVEGKGAKRPVVRELEAAFAQSLGVRVEILESKRKGSGKVVIHYKNLEDFDRVCERMNIELERL